jgi:hypothetical protein
MTRSKPTESNDLDFHAAGLLVKGQGSWTDSALAQFRHFLKLRRLSPSEDELSAALQRAQENYRSGKARFYLCAAEPCCGKIGFDVSEGALEQLSKDLAVPIAKTGCQGPCKQAPVMSLRIGDQQEMFAEVANDDAWRALLQYAKAAAQAGTCSSLPARRKDFVSIRFTITASRAPMCSRWNFSSAIFAARASTP